MGLALPGPGVSFPSPSHSYVEVIGRRAVLKPSGENIELDQHLPRRGSLSRQVALADWGDDWLVMVFDTAFEYGGCSVSYCLIRARWVGCPIGSDFCPVFVLTDNHDSLSSRASWTSKDFQFVSWGEVQVLAT